MDGAKREEIRLEIIRRLDLGYTLDDNEIQEVILSVIREYEQQHYLETQERWELAHTFFNELRRLDLLQDMLDDAEITEIMINGSGTIFIEKGGALYPSEGRFSSPEKLQDIIQQIVGSANRTVNESHPIADARLEDGSRINVVLPPVGVGGPFVTIRKFPKDRIRMRDLIRLKTITPEAASFLQMLVAAGYNIFISGGTGSGKTTFLNVLSDAIPKDERVIVIEDNVELQLTDVPNIVRLEARLPNTEGEGEVTIRDLIKTALRMRPDRVIVGEIRGPEAIDMLQSLNTGHDGSLSTGHANSSLDMLSRIETMVLMGMDIPLEAVRRQIASGIDIIVHLGRLRDKSRRVLEISEVLGYKDGEIWLQQLYRFRETGARHDKEVDGVLEKQGELRHRQKLADAGLAHL